MIGAPQIVDPYGQPVTSERVRLEKQTRFNPLVGWTPDMLTRQLAAWARGEIAPLAYLMEWLEHHDDTLATVVPKAKAAVAREGYDVVLKDEIAPELKGMAEDQRGIVQAFYDSVETGHAIDQDVRGGFRLLVEQTMDGQGKGWGTHHLIWNRGRRSLGLEAIQVPLWFWEGTEGKLRFLQNYGDARGVDRETLGGASAWMVSRGRGVMLACVIAAMFKRLPLQDWLTYCDRHGMPAFLGKTDAASTSDAWRNLLLAVKGIGSESAGVVNRSDTIEVLDLTTKGELPYEKLVDRMDRACVMLWRGGDLSTISRSNGVGANPQQEDSDDLDADRAGWVGETLDRNLTVRVKDFHFGYASPLLVKLKLRTKTRDNLKQDLETVLALKKEGMRISEAYVVGKFGVVLADQGERALGEPVQAAPTPGAPVGAPVNALNTATPEILQEAVAKALDTRPAFLAPLKPILTKLSDRVKDTGMTDGDFLDLAAELVGTVPELIDPSQAGDLAKVLEAAMSAAVIEGAREASRESK